MKRINIKDFLIGFIVGTLISATVAYAAGQISIVDGSGDAIGITANPIYIELI